MKYVSQFLLLAVFITLASCQKEFSLENAAPNTPTGIDSIYLDRVTEVYDDNAGTIDSLIKTFQYDNLKRVISFSEKSFENGVITDTSITSYFYNSTDTLPNKYAFLYRGISPVSEDTITGIYRYDTQGRVVLDSSTEAYKDLATGYIKTIDATNKQYAASVIYYNRKVTGLITPPSISVDAVHDDTAWLDGNKNILNDVSYTLSGSIPSLRLDYKGIYTYDNKPNPYKTLNIFPVLFINHEGNIVLSPQVNNCLSFYSEDYFFGSTPTVNSEIYTHTFNSKGLLIQTYGVDNYMGTDRYYYTYRAL